ncbi:hypothetical protein C5167_017905 [Papaver somniferum]|uniref:Uncharacterized protein n=1 Tax=Papaver somniferum TaxID=3469 RepID=A0A4Y7IPU1_PAPSO|nr:hypothetical protein C5167_017905 [Papaver somniferum]
MNRFQGKLEVFYNNRWLVFVAAMWVQSVARTGYLFGSISPVIKSSLNYNQKQIARLGVAMVGFGLLLHTGFRLCLCGGSAAEETLLPETTKQEPTSSSQDLSHEVIFSELEDEKSSEEEPTYVNDKKKRIQQLQAKIYKAAAAGAVRVKRRKGSGLTVIDNLGQMSQSLGYDNPHIFVSMISIWNFLGRISGGYFSEIVVKDYAYPRPVSMAVAQVLMEIGHFFFAMGWPGEMHIGTLLIGLGYGAHWAIVPDAASELFGLKKFGALYNFLLLANPAGSLVFSGVIASSIYDSEAKKQAEMHGQLLHNSRGVLRRIADVILAADEPLKCEGSICFFLTSMIMSGFCIVAVVLSMILVHRTKVVYASLYGKSRT